MIRPRSVLALLLAVAATPALAHPGGAEAHGFFAGLMHPFDGADHVLAMTAAGLWAGIVGGRSAFAWPVAFLAAMGSGFAASLSGFAVPMVEVGIALSVVALGAAAAFGLRMSAALGAAVCALFAAFHGVAHGAEMPAGAAAVAYFAGFALSTSALLGAGVAAVRFGRVARIAGLGVAGAGLALLAG